MSEALEAEQKTNPQGDPITSVAAPKPEGKKDPHADAKRQKVVTPEYMFHRSAPDKGIHHRQRSGQRSHSSLERRFGDRLSHHAAERDHAVGRRALWRRLCEGILPRRRRGRCDGGHCRRVTRRRAVLHGHSWSWDVARHGRHCVMAWSSVACRGHVHLPRRECAVWPFSRTISKCPIC